MELQPYQQRVVDEMSELKEKANRLESFITGDTFLALDKVDQGLLIAQLDVMGAYLRILGLRVLRFG